MKKTLIILAVIALAAALLYLSPLNRAEKASAPVEEVVIEDRPSAQSAQLGTSTSQAATAVSSNQVVTGIISPAGSTVTPLSDGSSITTVEDGRGNRVESRFIDGDRQIKGIIVNTSVDGAKQVRIMLADGSSKLLGSEPLTDVIRATPSQIASALGVFGDLTIRKTPTPFVEPSPSNEE